MTSLARRCWPFGAEPAEPAVEVVLVQDDRHAIVDGHHQFIGVGGDDGVALQPSTVRGVLPFVQSPAKAKGRSSAIEMAKTRSNALAIQSHAIHASDSTCSSALGVRPIQRVVGIAATWALRRA